MAVEFPMDQYWLILVRKYAGSDFESRCKDPETVLQLLNDESPAIRAAALLIGKERFDMLGENRFRAKCLEIASSDDENPQFLALVLLQEHCSGTSDPEVGAVFLKVFRDERVTPGNRNAAYRALRKLHFGYQPEDTEGLIEDGKAVLAKQPIRLIQADPDFLASLPY